MDDDDALEMGGTESSTEEQQEGGPIEVSDDLIAFLKAEYDRCQDTALEQERATAIKRYNGEAYGDEEDGRSQVVARDTFEVVNYMVASILRTIVSGDRVVEFAHKNAEVAREATETIMWLLMDVQDGYTMLHDWLKAGLLEKNAVAMTFMETPPPRRKLYEGVSEDTLAVALSRGAKLLEAEDNGDGRFDVAMLLKRQPEFPDYAVPNEEFYCSPEARTIDDALLKGRRMLRHVGDLVAEGYDADELGMANDDPERSGPLATSRDDGRYEQSGVRNGDARQIWWFEEFARFDANGDGIAELLYIRRTSDYTVFDIDEMEEPDDHPFVDWCPLPMPHRRIGQSIADSVMDLERIRTVFMRQTLDGAYHANTPRTYLHESSIGETTIEDLLNPRVGGIIRYKGAQPPVERQGAFAAADGLHMLEWVTGERESRTGITRLNQGLDAEALNKTATGTALMQSQGQQMEEYVARNFGNGLAKLFTKKARLLKKYGQPLMVPIDGNYKQVDPSKWPDDMIARPRLGLGASRKEQKLQYLASVMGMQKELVMAGKDNLVTDKNIYNAIKAFIADTALGETGDFITDPAPVDPQTGQPIPQQQKPPKPDPEMAKVQGQMQIEQVKLQGQQQAAAQSAELERQKAEAKLVTEQQIAAAKLDMERQRAAFEAELAQAKSQAEIEMAYTKMAAEMQLREQQMAHDHEARMREVDAKTELSDNRPGGALDE